MPKQTILILKTGPNECRVWPPHQFLNTGDTVAWENRTGDSVTLTFPSPGHPTPAGTNLPFSAIAAQAIAHNNNHATAAVAGTATKGRYPYQIFCEATRSFAEGGSDGDVDI